MTLKVFVPPVGSSTTTETTVPGLYDLMRTIAVSVFTIFTPSMLLTTELTGIPAADAPSPALRPVIFAPIPV